MLLTSTQGILYSLSMNETLSRFRALTLTRTGLALRDGDLSQASTALQARFKALRVNSATYLQLLTGDDPAAEREWARLMPHLTNGESYFFRDTGQITLLRNQLLPELIARHAERRVLQLWSAGCSSGEEPYSLAMLLDELLPHRLRDGWRISILGTDINEQAIERGRQGVYRPWSLRALEPAVRERYFRETPHGWQIASRLRDMVTFTVGNLRADSFPRAGGPHAMDVILCRNVLIYFDRAAVSEVLRKFSTTLNPGGYLLTGHAELHPQDLSGLRPRLLTGSVVYERPAASETLMSNPLVSSQALPPKVATSLLSGATATVMRAPTESATRWASLTPPLAPAQSVISAADATVQNKRLVPTPLHASPSSPAPEDAVALLRAAHAHANAGRYDEAITACERAVAQNAFGAAPHLLLARIAEERGQVEDAVSLLKKAIYLAPDCTLAYLELGALYAGRGEIMRARQMRAIALEQLEAGSNPYQEAPHQDGLGSALRGEIAASHHSQAAGDAARQAMIEQLHALLGEQSLTSGMPSATLP